MRWLLLVTVSGCWAATSTSAPAPIAHVAGPPEPHVSVEPLEAGSDPVPARRGFHVEHVNGRRVYVIDTLDSEPLAPAVIRPVPKVETKPLSQVRDELVRLARRDLVVCYREYLARFRTPLNVTLDLSFADDGKLSGEAHSDDDQVDRCIQAYMNRWPKFKVTDARDERFRVAFAP